MLSNSINNYLLVEILSLYQQMQSMNKDVSMVWIKAHVEIKSNEKKNTKVSQKKNEKTLSKAIDLNNTAFIFNSI